MFAAFLDGWRRVLRARVLWASMVLALTLAGLLIGHGLGITWDQTLLERLGGNLEAEAGAALWQAASPGDTSDLRTFIESNLLGAGAFVFLWLFLSGGILDRLARNRRVGTAQFFAASGVYFFRFLRLWLVVFVTCFALFNWGRPYLYSDAIFLLVVALVNLISDFAKVRAVVEDRRSMLGSIGAAMRFIRRRPIRTAGLYTLNVLAGTLVLLLWEYRVAPSSGASAGLQLLMTNLYLAVRIGAELAFMASEVSLFQKQLAHAEYTAAPELVWPDSPAVEAIQNLSRSAKNGALSSSK